MSRDASDSSGSSGLALGFGIAGLVVGAVGLVLGGVGVRADAPVVALVRCREPLLGLPVVLR